MPHNDDTQTDQSLPAEQIAKAVKKRGSKSASIEATTTATSSESSDVLGNVLYWYDKKPVRTDEECADRLNEFFRHVAQTGEIPTVEKMGLALGVARTTVWNWKNGIGCNSTRVDMIKKAYDILAAMDAELVSRNKIPQVTYIFRAKNFFDMADQQQIIVTPSNPLDGMSQTEARNRYTQALPEMADDSE